MKKRIGELGLVLLCTSLVLLAPVAAGQEVRDAKTALQQPSQVPVEKNPAPVIRDQSKAPTAVPLTAQNPAPAAHRATGPMLTPAAAAPQGVKSASILPAKGEVLPATDLPAPPNDNCADAEVVYLTSGVPAYVSGDNTGATEDCPALSGGAYGESWYLLDLPAQMNVTIKYCGTTPAFCNAYIVMDTTCPCSGSWIFAGNWENTSCGDGNWTLYWFNLPAGQYYWPLLMDATCAYGPYTIEFFGEEPQPCAECPPGGTPEPEPCGEDLDGGCNFYPPMFADIHCGETICGTAWADSYIRDTDWYQLTVGGQTDFTWSGEAEFPFLMFIIQGAGPNDCSTYSILEYASAGYCQPISLNSGPVGAGTYWFWAGPSTWGAYPCTLNYVATLDCVIPMGACCVDLVCVGDYTQEECAAMGGYWFYGQSCATGFQCPTGCPHYIWLYDCFGDGWNDNYLDVLVNSVTVLDNITLPSGTGPATYMFIADTGDAIQTIYYPYGGWPYEPYYFIYDGQGYLIGQDGIAGSDCYVQPTGIYATGNCEPATTGACCYYDGNCELVGGPQYCLDGVWLGFGSQCFQCPCLVPCPPGSYYEAEPCGADTNGGCNFYPPMFEYIDCGTTICGTVWADSYLRDTDWYELTVGGTTEFTWSGEAELPFLLFIIQGAGPSDCSSYSILQSGSASECTEIVLSSGAVGAGTYWFWAGPSTWGDFPCELHYVARLDCVIPMGACCVDMVCVGDYTDAECAALGGYWFGGQTCANFVCPTGCPHHIYLYDCYGDGWNGNYLDVLVNGVPQLTGITLPSGVGPAIFMFIADTGDTIQTIYYPYGGWPYEPYYFIYDGQGYLIGQDGIVGSDCYVQPTGITAIGNCLPATTGACCYYDGGCEILPPDQCFDGVFLGLGTQCWACPCLVPCPPGASQEPEPCGEDLDGGCNFYPPMFADIHCGETMCGTAWADSYIRDTDWYLLSTSSANVFTWSGQAEFPFLLFIIKGGSSDPCTGYSIITYATATECTEITLNSGVMQPGNYMFWAGPSTWGDYPCTLNYVVRLDCVEVVGACCLYDAPYCVVVTGSECDALGGSFQGAFTECNFAVDCNANGRPDDCDLALGISQDCNNNGIPDECDIANGTSNDCQPDGIPDECQLWTDLRVTLQLDDGSAENNWGLTAGGELCWLNHFTAGSPGSLQGVWTSFGSAAYPGTSGVTPGQPVRVYVWDDPNGDGNPVDAVFLGEGNGTADAGAIDTDVPQLITFGSAVNVGLSFFCGASVVTSAGGYPAPADDNGWTGAPDQGFLTFNSVPFDPTQITANLYPMSALGYPLTVFITRAEVYFGAPPNDCNENGIPDECDIGTQWGGYCTGPDCETDWNGNGVPDSCEVCGDLDFDGDVDMDDYWIFAGAFGTCVGDPKFVPMADMDGDGCITLADYRAWRMCYKMYNGKDFSLPKKDVRPAQQNGVVQ